MHQLSPPESVHALDIAALRKPEITFWTAWSQDELLGCGALKALAPRHGEVKSMRTVSAKRRAGVGRAMLEHIVAEARARSYVRLSLETGAMEAFAPARRLYESFGFTYCAPFAGLHRGSQQCLYDLCTSVGVSSLRRRDRVLPMPAANSPSGRSPMNQIHWLAELCPSGIV